MEMVRTIMEYIGGNLDWVADRLCDDTEQSTVKYNRALRGKNKGMLPKRYTNSVIYDGFSHTEYCIKCLELVGFLQDADNVRTAAGTARGNTSTTIIEMFRNILSHHAGTVVALYEAMDRRMDQEEKQEIGKWLAKLYRTTKLKSTSFDNHVKALKV